MKRLVLNIPYSLSKNLSLEDRDTEQCTRTIFNKITGSRIKVSDEVIKLFKLFRRPKTLEQVFRLLHFKNISDRKMICNTLRYLISSDTLVKEEKARDIDKDSDIFVKPRQTFVSSPYIPQIELPKGDGVLFCGVPVDFATTGYPGARMAPEKLRDVSTRFVQYERDVFSLQSKGWYSMTSEQCLLKNIPVGDCGDIAYELSENPKGFYHRCYKAARLLFSTGYLPVFLGGDHSITPPIVRAYEEKVSGTAIIQIDAHTDLAEWVGERNHHHGNMMTRVLAENPKVTVYQYGMRGFAGEPTSNKRLVQTYGGEIDTSLQKVIQKIPRNKNCYITFDVDSLDPVYAPGTGTPVPFGMEPKTLTILIREIAKHNTIVAIDIVELNPMLDTGDRTTSLVFHLLMEILGDVFRYR